MNAIDRGATVAQIALDHPVTARVFRDHRIDFCCRGALTVPQACSGKGLDAAAVFADLDRAVEERRTPTDDPRLLPTSRLIEFVVSRHHAYLRRTLPFVDSLGRKVARAHKEHDPRLPGLADVVTELRETLETHLDDEERSLFPALAGPAPDARRLTQALRGTHDDHLRVGEMLTCIRTLTDDYAVPDWACGSYRALMFELEAIELDTLRHVHIENHVLMPRFEHLDAGLRGESDS